MKSLFAVLILIATLFAGCATQPSQPGAEKPRLQPSEEKPRLQPSEEKPPKHAKRVKISMYDSAPRAKSDHFEVLDEMRGLIQKPHKVIALLTCDGTVNEEGVMTEAIIYRARMIGADAVIILPRNNYREAAGLYGIGGATRSVYRANAVVYQP